MVEGRAKSGMVGACQAHMVEGRAKSDTVEMLAMEYS
jgi:hypothetical protein